MKAILSLIFLFLGQLSASSSPLLWPWPTQINYSALSSPLLLDPNSFKIQSSISFSSTLLTNAIDRYQDLIFSSGDDEPTDRSGFVTLASLIVKVSSPNQVLNSTTDESFSLIITSDGTATLSSFVNFNAQTKTYSIAFSTSLSHSPRFAHRGLLVDTARHYLPIDTIRGAIRALAYSGMSVLHWHMVDAESFPLLVGNLGKGAYDEKLTYTLQDVRQIVSYGESYGIRVIVEYDTPGHSASWGIGEPGIVAKCPKWSGNINNVPLNPTIPETLQVVSNLFQNVSQNVIDDFWHIGGDEVVYQCFAEDPGITTWMTQHGYGSNYDYLMRYYEQYLFGLFQGKLGKTMIAWEEVFTSYGLADVLPKDLIIEVWKDEPTLISVAQAGLRGILAYGWYLDQRQLNWKDFYSHEPFSSSSWTPTLESRIIGGEVSAWAEYLNEYTFETEVNTRLFAVAERLSSPQQTTSVTFAQPRLSQFLCHLNARGIRSSPLGPGFCP